MAISEQSGDANLAEAVDVYSAYLRESQASPGPNFGRLCDNHPHLAEKLQKFHAVVQLAQAVANSRSFHQSLREHFGEGAEVTVQLEEGVGVPPSGGPASTPAEAGTPSQIGRYALEDEVAHGGMGVIWRVRDRDLSRTLAMKVMTGAPGTSAATDATSRINLARFLEEAQVTAQLDHPGIVPVHEVGFDAKGQPFFIMKLVKGRDLNEIFKLARAEEEGWNLPRAVGVVVKACQALAYAHSKGVIHRDLKPANIMVGRFGEVYVMDWGLAKITGRKDLHDIRPKEMQLTSASIHSKRREDTESTPDSPLITMDGSVVGTPAYMPPEQAQGQVEQVDPLSDVYSLGAILYNLLTGQAPYVEPGARISPHTILARVLDGPPKRVNQLNPQAPSELIAICEKAMAREKRNRYPSSLDLAEDLQAFLDHRVVRAYRTGAVAEFKSWVARNKTAALAGSASIAMVLLFSTLYAVREQTNAVRERANALQLKHSLARQYLHRGQALCEQGDMARGLHWLARSLKEAPEPSTALRESIQQNLIGWGQQWRVPRAMLLHDSVVTTSALSPDGQRAVTGNRNGVVQFWSAETGEPLPLSLKHNESILVVRFSPDGTRLVTSSDDQTLRLWNTETGEPVGPPVKQAAPVEHVAFSPDGRRVVTGGTDGTVRLWAVATGEPMGAPMPHESEVNSVAFSQDGLQVLTASEDKTARLWNGETGEPIGSPMRHARGVLKAVFSPDGKRLATSCADDSVRLWNVSNVEPMGKLMLHEGVEAVAFSPDGQRLLTAGGDRAARFWNALTGESAGVLLMHAQAVDAAVFSTDGRQVLTGSRDGTVRLWSAETGESLSTPMHYEGAVWTASLSLDGRTVLAHGPTHAVALWSVQTESPRGVAFPVKVSFGTVSFAPDGRRLLVGDRNGQAWWWSVDTGEAVRATLQHDERIWCVALSPDGKRALTGSADNTARLWSLEGKERLLGSFVHLGDVRAVVFSPDGKLIATASFDRTARLWSVETGQPVGAPLPHPNMVEDVAFSPDGALLGTACGDGAARLWSVKTRQPIGPAMLHRSSVLGLAFSPDGRQLVTASRDKTVRFWSVPTGRPTGLALEHRGSVDDVCFSPDGKRLATASIGVRLWSLETGELLGPRLGRSGPAQEVMFSPDGTRIAVGSPFDSARLWPVPSPFQGAVRHAELWVQVITWQEMDDHGVLEWLDRATWQTRRAQLEKLGGAVGRGFSGQR